MKEEDKKFIKKIYGFYTKQGRAHLPWRSCFAKASQDKQLDPYKIWISEIMLQQTQVERVIPKYKEFLKKFPAVRALARAPQSEVLGFWNGLGYNRRAILLKRAAEMIVSNYSGAFPKTKEELKVLPGIGPYTAGAISAFAYNQPEVFIETNIRSVYIHFYFPKKKKVHDDELFPIIERTLDRTDPRQWYWALMDYGAQLKKETPNPSRRSKHHGTQSAFKGSVREVRGDILRTLLSEKKATKKTLQKDFERERFEKAIAGLVKENMIQRKGEQYFLT